MQVNITIDIISYMAYSANEPAFQLLYPLDVLQTQSVAPRSGLLHRGVPPYDDLAMALAVDLILDRAHHHIVAHIESHASALVDFLACACGDSLVPCHVLVSCNLTQLYLVTRFCGRVNSSASFIFFPL